MLMSKLLSAADITLLQIEELDNV